MFVTLPERIHFIGIGGTGMSSIARVLLEQGKSVSGSDIVSSETTRQLEQDGATIYIGHASNNVSRAQLVVVSTAINSDNPELQAAKQQQIPIVHRSEVWAHLLNAGQGVAVAGAHGKTTITAMIAWVLSHSGHDPTFLIGGSIPNFGSGRFGQGRVVVAEADESDASFLRYHPYAAIITSVDADHLEAYHGDVTNLYAAYRQFLSQVQTEGVVVLCADDDKVMQFQHDVTATRCVTYGLHENACVSARNIQHDGRHTTADVYVDGSLYGTISLKIPGQHNVQNALAVVALCLQLGVDRDDIVQHLATYTGTKRRFQIVYDANDILLVDDYAHHPSEVRATLRATRHGWPHRRIVALFQPHRYSRTHFLFHDFVTAFSDADYVIITEVHAPSNEKPIEGVSGKILAAHIQTAQSDTPVHFIASQAEIVQHLQNNVQHDDVVVAMGAGDVWKTIRKFADELGNPT